MQTIETHTGPPSPLVAIKHKELELAAELALARQAAERDVEAARQRATSMLRHIEREAQEAVAIRYRAALEAAEQQASTIRAGGQRAAAAITAQGTPLVAEAAARIVAIVVPAVKQDATASVGMGKARVDHA